MITDNFLKNLRTLMDKNSLNDAQFTKLLGKPPGAVNAWFRKKSIPNDETIDMLAKYFQIEPYYFFMEPGTQKGEIKPADRHDDFKTLLDEIAEKCLEGIELETYHELGPNEFIRIMRINYEGKHVLAMPWYTTLCEELRKYTSVDLQAKLNSILSEGQAKQAKTS